VADVEVTLGAKNEASAVLRQFSAEVTQTAQQVEFSIRGLAQLAGVTAAVIGVVEAGRAIAGFASSSVTAFDQLNRSAVKLSETIKLIPGSGQAAASELQKTANSLERITNIDAAKIMDQMSQALRRGAGVNAVEDMTEAAVGLSRVFDRDLSSAMRMVEDAANGNFAAFEGLIPQIATMATVEEKLAAVSELATQGFINKANSAKDAVEASDALRIASNNLYESFGSLLAPIRDVVYRGFAVAFEFIQSSMIPALEDFQGYAKQLVDSMQGVGQSVAEGFVTGFTAAEIAVFRFEDVMDSVSASILLSVNRLVNDSVFAFQEMAVQAAWLVENIGAITAVVAMGKTTFTEAFQDMPDFGERALTETERSLQAILDESVLGLTEDFNGKLRERLASLRESLNLDVDINLRPRTQGGAANSLQQQLRALQGFESRVLVRGQTDSPIAKLVENTAKQVTEQQKTNTLLQGVNVSPNEELRIEVIK
jgi:hypothetical protein